jgi:uncharacterized protein
MRSGWEPEAVDAVNVAERARGRNRLCTMAMLPFSLARVILSDTHPAQRIILREVGGDRHFTIEIGEPEAVAIYRRAMKRYHPRPLTHDLLDNVIAGMGGTVKAVEITDLKDHTYYANLVIEPRTARCAWTRAPATPSPCCRRQNVDLFVDEDRVLEPPLRRRAVVADRGARRRPEVP